MLNCSGIKEKKSYGRMTWHVACNAVRGKILWCRSIHFRVTIRKAEDSLRFISSAFESHFVKDKIICGQFFVDILLIFAVTFCSWQIVADNSTWFLLLCFRNRVNSTTWKIRKCQLHLFLINLFNYTETHWKRKET